MRTAKIKDMKKGWFVGNFTPSLYKTEAVEAAVKHFKAGEVEPSHYHKIATEITVVVSGKVKMFNTVWESGDIIIADPEDITGFEAVTDAVLTVLKLPGTLNDKYLI